MAERTCISPQKLLGVAAILFYALSQLAGALPGGEAGEEAGGAPEVMSDREEWAAPESSRPVAAVAARDPFWPVGYAPARAVEAVVTEAAEISEPDPEDAAKAVDLAGLSEQEQEAIRASMKVGGIIERRGQSLAIINNQLVKEGDQIAVAAGARTFQLKVRSLTPDKVVLEAVH